MKFENISYYKIALSVFCVAILIVALVFGKEAYSKKSKSNSRFSMVDIDYILLQIKKTAQPEIFSAKPDDAPQRKIFLDNFNAKVSELEKAVDHFADECRCIILVRGAVISGEVPDLTDQVLQRLGLDAKAEGEK